MPELSLTLRRARVASLSAMVAIVAAGTAAATPVIASEGSVPAEVVAYATAPSGLVARLDDLFGGSGGINFDDTTKVGQINRVFTFTEEFTAGLTTETPVELANEWTAPVSIADEPLGLATIWINPASVKPELADFVVDGEVAALLSDVPADAYLVRDSEHNAWFVLVDAQLTALVGGSSGITGPTPISVYQDILVNRSSQEPRESLGQDVSAIAPALVIALGILIVAAILLVPQLLARRRDRARQETDAEPSHPVDDTAPAELATPEPVTTPEAPPPATKPPTKPRTKAQPKPAAAEAEPASSPPKSPSNPSPQSKPKPRPKPQPKAQPQPKPLDD